MKGYTVDDFDALIGIDWADTKHDICENPSNSITFLYSVIKSKPEALHEWTTNLKLRYLDKPVAVVCELKKAL